MQFSSALLVAASFALANAAEFTMDASFFVTYAAGTAMNLTWDQASGPVTLLLKNGPSTALNTVATIQTGLTGTSFTFTPSSTLANGQYAFEIDDSTGANYSKFFTLTGGSAASASGSTTASGSTSGSTTATTSGASTTATTSNASKTTGSTTTKSSPSNSPTSSPSSSTTPKINSAPSFASPLALVLLALAAMVTLN